MASSEIIFDVASDVNKREMVQCSGQENQTLRGVLEKHSVLARPIEEYIFKALVKTRSEQVVVNPNILCGWLDKGAEIQTYRLTGTEKETLSEAPIQKESVSHDVSHQVLFFVNIDRPPKTRNITRISYDKCKTRYLCVSAVGDNTLLDALKNDGRFLKPEAWKLKKNKSTVLLEAKANSCKNYVFDVEVTVKRRRDESIGRAQIKTEKCEEDGKVVSSSSPMPAELTSLARPLHEKILELAKSRANELLAKTKCRKLGTLIEKWFSKSVNLSKSAWLMEQLVMASKSVGRIYPEPGSFSGTCFLMKEDVILTNYHVFEDIKNEIASCHGNQMVKVSFNHLHPNQSGDLETVDVNMDDIRAHCPNESLDYIFLGLKTKFTLQPELSERVSLVNPKNFSNNLLTIIGHPDGREKHIDSDCHVISQHIWRPELLDRLQ